MYVVGVIWGISGILSRFAESNVDGFILAGMQRLVPRGDLF